MVVFDTPKENADLDEIPKQAEDAAGVDKQTKITKGNVLQLFYYY